MKTVAELEKELAIARRREQEAAKKCPLCDGAGWICDTTYDRTGVMAVCDRCYGTGLPSKRVEEIIRQALAPYRKPLSVTGESP